MVPFYEQHRIRLSRVLTDRGTEFCGSERHEYELYLAVEDIDHSRTKTKSPQTNGICERFHRTVLDEFYRVAFRKKIYRAVDELQADLDAWTVEYNQHRPHQGRWCFGKVESPGGLPPPGAPRSVREPLNSYGSRCSAVSMAELPVGKEGWIYSA